MTIKTTENYRVFAYADSYVSKGLSAINIRIANRLNRNDNINIPVYLTNGERLRANPKNVESGKIKGNNEANIYLDNLTNLIINFISTAKSFNKKLIEKMLYGDGFLDQHKKRRTRSLEIPQYTYTTKPSLINFRQDFPKQKKLESTSTIDTDGFKVTQQHEIVIDPLSLEDFPKNFDKNAFDKLYEEYVSTGRGQLNDPKHENNPQMREIDNAWVIGDFKNYIKQKFFDKDLNSSITIDKATIEGYEKNHSKIRYASNGRPMIAGFMQSRLVRMQQATDITNLPTEVIFKKGLWNKKNIFEMFASTYYDESVNDTYTKIVVRLMEYREHCKPPEDVKDFNANWVNAFFNWLQKTGWYAINTKNFDPLKYDASIFFQDKKRTEYQIKSLNKMKGIVKALTVGVKGEKTISFYKKGWIPQIDLSM